MPACYILFEKKAIYNNTEKWVIVDTRYYRDRVLLFEMFGKNSTIFKTQLLPCHYGLPDDLKGKIEDGNYMATDERYDTPMFVFIGYHSYLWLTSTTILEWVKQLTHKSIVSILTLDNYKRYKESNLSPVDRFLFLKKHYCTIFSITDNKQYNKFVVSTESDCHDKTTHVIIFHTLDLRELVEDFIDDIKDVHNENGEVRLIVGFTS